MKKNKNKVKLLLLLISLFILTACSSNDATYENNDIDTIHYNLNISDVYREQIITLLPSNAYELASSEEDNDIESLEKVLLYRDSYPLLANFDILYNKRITENESGFRVVLDHEFLEDDFINSTFLNTCFEKKNIVQEDDSLEINLSGRINCYIDKTIIIYVTTNHEVLESNGLVTDQTYYWVIDNSNKDNLDIHYKISRAQSLMKRNYNSNHRFLFNIIYIITLSIIIIVFIIIYNNYSHKGIRKRRRR